MARQAGGQDAIEDIYPASDAVDQVFGGADSHQVARLGLGQERRDHVEHGVHFVFRLAHREAADGDAGRIERSDKFSGGRSKVRVNAALHNPEEGLVGASLGLETTLGPVVSPLHCDSAVLVVVGIGTFIEGHDDVRAETLLNADGAFRREVVRRTVNVTLEGHAFVINLAGLRQRENLESARVGQHGTRPLHEAMQSAQLGDEVIAGTEVEVIGVAQHERRTEVRHLRGRQRLDGGLCADGRENGRLEGAVRRGECPRAGAVVAGSDGEVKHEGDYTLQGAL